MRLFLWLPVWAAWGAEAATLNKCVDANGGVTFTQTTCPDGGAAEAINVGQGGAGMLLGPVVSDELAEEEAPTSRDKVVVVGGSSGSECSSVSEQDMRSAIVRNQVMKGMTAKQVEQAWGKPGAINRSSSGDQWVYYRGPVEMQFVYVNSAGCVTAWN